jgi:myo-inositol 2-dehydrogenase/D-chiro-inositol 1-dehydrogenase
VYDGTKVEDVKLAHHSGEVFELRQEIAMCVRCVREGTKPIATGEDGMWSTGLCLASEESVRKGGQIDLKSFLNR